MSKKPSFDNGPAKVNRTLHEIDEVTEAASENINQGRSKFPGMTYEEGVRNALDWIVGDLDESPMED